MSERGAAERRKARALPGTEFRGVSCRPGGKFGAKILDSKGKSQIWLGTFDTAEDAARAVDAAAVRMQGAAARTNFKQPDGGVSSPLHVHAEPSAGHDGRTKFRGVCPQSSGKFGARISKGGAETWLGTFDTAEEAARAYDAAAVRVCGRRARTNFEQPAAVDHEPALSSLGVGGFDSHADLSVDLPPAEWQQVDDLLKGMDSTNDTEKMIKAAATLWHISLAGHGDGGRAEPA